MARQVAQRDDKSTKCASAISYRGLALAQWGKKRPNKLPVKMSEPDAQIIRRRNGSLDSVERLLGFVPGCMKLFSAGGPAREAYFI